MSSTGPSTPTSKVALPSVSVTFSQAPSTGASDLSQRRSGGSGSFGAGASTKVTSQARNNQPLRKQHKAQRRAKLVDEDAIAESAAMKSTTSRKGQTSITHLMNFSLPPRPYFQHQHYHPNNRYQRRNPTWGLGSGYHAVDKARYVHANYRFVVRPDREYHAQTADADIHVGWDALLQILASAATQATGCPICLSVPVAPRMAKCGHIFCLPCLIRYMHSSDDLTPVPEKRARWKKCPICEDSIYISEVRPVRWYEGQEANMLREGGDVLLRLLMREPGTTLALPRDTLEAYGHQDEIPWFNVAEMMDYARFMKGSEDYMKAQYDCEISALQEQEKEDELIYGDEDTWTRKAVNAIYEARSRLDGIGNPPDNASGAYEKRPRRGALLVDSQNESPAMSRQSQAIGTNTSRPLLMQSTSKPAVATLTDSIDTLDMGAAPEVSSKPTQMRLKTSGGVRPANHPFFFYHALPNFFLSPLDIRILKAAFGDFSQFPPTILPRVEHISTGHIVDEDLRKRAKYMGHLPYGCEVSFVECDWTDIIAPSVLKDHQEDIEKRRKRNNEKEAREERERLRAEKEEDDKRWATARRRRPSNVSKSISNSDFLPLTQPHQPEPESLEDDPAAFSSSPPWGHSRVYSSFTTLASPGTSPDAHRTVWGTAAIPTSSPPLVSSEIHQPALDDGWLQDWENDLLDQDDAVAMVEASLDASGPSKHSASSKKKKNKKITLMSTNARRGA